MCLDFTELFAYNFATERPPDGEPRPPLDTVEAVRIIVMEVRVTKIEAPGPGDGTTLPVVHFTGTTRSTRDHWDVNGHATIRGVFILLPPLPSLVGRVCALFLSR